MTRTIALFNNKGGVSKTTDVLQPRLDACRARPSGSDGPCGSAVQSKRNGIGSY